LARLKNANQPSQAQPTPFVQVYERRMQLSPQALPLRQVLQHAAFIILATGSGFANT